jgi:hypothetical protein
VALTPDTSLQSRLLASTWSLQLLSYQEVIRHTGTPIHARTKARGMIFHSGAVVGPDADDRRISAWATTEIEWPLGNCTGPSF